MTRRTGWPAIIVFALSILGTTFSFVWLMGEWAINNRLVEYERNLPCRDRAVKLSNWDTPSQTCSHHDHVLSVERHGDDTVSVCRCKRGEP